MNLENKDFEEVLEESSQEEVQEVENEEQPLEEVQEVENEEQPLEEVAEDEPQEEIQEELVEEQPQEEIQEEVSEEQPQEEIQEVSEEQPQEEVQEEVAEEQPQEEVQEEVAEEQPQEEVQEEVVEGEPQEEVQEEVVEGEPQEEVQEEVVEGEPQEEVQEEVVEVEPQEEIQEEVSEEQIQASASEGILRLEDHQELKDLAATWFNEKWGIDKETYLESMEESFNGTAVPSWYIIMEDGKIIAGAGVIENDFHFRKDLAPNVCALYVEEDHRKQGIAGRLLNYIVEDMKQKGVETLYLLTNLHGFYERYGWKFFTTAVSTIDRKKGRVYTTAADIV